MSAAKYKLLFTLVIGITSGVFFSSCSRQQEARSERPDKVQQWEYKLVFPSEEANFEQRRKKAEEKFNALGADGWEYAGGAAPFFTFKRPRK